MSRQSPESNWRGDCTRGQERRWGAARGGCKPSGVCEI